MPADRIGNVQILGNLLRSAADAKAGHSGMPVTEVHSRLFASVRIGGSLKAVARRLLVEERQWVVAGSGECRRCKHHGIAERMHDSSV